MYTRGSALALSLMLSAWSMSSQAVIIQFTTTFLGGNQYRYDYTVTNDVTGSPNIDEFTIYFDHTMYENLSSPVGPVDWDAIVEQYDPAIPADGYYDALALGLPIGVSETLGGFSVIFDWLGSGTPGSQAFDIVDPVSFETLLSGVTTSALPVTVPEPSSLSMLLAGLLLGLWRLRSVRLVRAGVG